MKLTERVIGGLLSSRNPRKSMDLEVGKVNYYDKTAMTDYLLQSKNGCLNSDLDLFTYLCHPLLTLILKKIELDAATKNSYACRLIHGALHLSNINWVATKNILLYKTWLRV